MATVTRRMDVAPDDVYEALADPNTYPEWLVGAREIRAVDSGWPTPGTQFHHRVGLVGPLTIADSTRSLEVEPGRRLVLEAKARPAGRARVEFEIEPDGDGTNLVMTETPLGVLKSAQPLIDPLTIVRNTKSLRDLEGYVRAQVGTDPR